MPEQDSKTEKSTEKKESSQKKMLAAILIRGSVGAVPDVKTTLKDLNLYTKNNCVLMEDTPVFRGMLEKVKDFITWGEVSADIAKEIKNRKDKHAYRLHPPRGGFERKGIKKPYNNGGALGKRDNMEELIKKMN